jgi:diguanylate cyclase (GGDEF)-like protein
MPSDIPPEVAFELKVMFLRELAQGYTPARAAMDQLLKEPADAHFLELQRYFHKIAGTAHAVDLPVLGHLAAICEDMSKLILKKGITPLDKGTQLLAEGLTAVNAVLNEQRAPKSPATVAANAAASTGQTIPAMPSSDDLSLSKILVIDDDPVSAALIDSTLRGAGFQSSYCCDPEQALNMVQSELPDLIVLDVAMPGLDGFEVCRRVRSHPALQFTPIIFVTRKGDVEERVEGLKVGGNDYIAKPFESPELVARVRSHLQRLAELRNMAVRDGLTRCYNHKYFKNRLDQEVGRSRRYKDELSLAMLDIDYFKKINDSYGHPAGDAVLSHLANLVVASVRSTDVVARYGGEEFGVLFVQATAQEAGIISNRIRERIENHRFTVPSGQGGELTRIPVTISVGVTQFFPEDTVSSFLQRADSTLYQSKKNGRNQVRVAETTDSEAKRVEEPRRVSTP